MDVFDIIGPVMVGPSSSHTAGAVRIGYVCRKLLGEEPTQVKIGLCGSFWATGKGHGTDKALIAGLLGYLPDDPRIPESFSEADKAGLAFSFYKAEKRDVHPNTAILEMEGKNGGMTVTACSIGGGRIRVSEIDGLTASFSGDLPTLIVHNEDRPGYVTEVTSMLSKSYVNIASMQLYRNTRGGSAIMILECDQEVSQISIETLSRLEGIKRVTYLSLK